MSRTIRYLVAALALVAVEAHAQSQEIVLQAGNPPIAPLLSQTSLLAGPKLKGEVPITLRLMDDVSIPRQKQEGLVAQR